VLYLIPAVDDPTIKQPTCIEPIYTLSQLEATNVPTLHYVITLH